MSLKKARRLQTSTSACPFTWHRKCWQQHHESFHLVLFGRGYHSSFILAATPPEECQLQSILVPLPKVTCFFQHALHRDSVNNHETKYIDPVCSIMQSSLLQSCLSQSHCLLHSQTCLVAIIESTATTQFQKSKNASVIRARRKYMNYVSCIL